jgi:hypothetical protein
LVWVFEDSAVERNERLETYGRFLVLELLERAEGYRVDVELEHVEDLVVEGSAEGKAVRALLRVKGEGEEGGVVLQREEFEGCKDY